MIEFGKSLRSAREAKGLSVRQIAEQTRMAPTTVQDLESENFSRIAAPIYGRGFVKLYCEALGLDPKPYIDEFMEIFSGNRETGIRERPLPEEAKAPATPVPPPPPPPPAAEPDLFHQAATEQPIAPTAASPSPEPTLSRYASPVRQNPSAVNLYAYLRLGLLAAGAVVLLALLFFGIRAVYRATTRTTEPSSASAPTPAAEQPKTSRTPQKIPSLYID